MNDLRPSKSKWWLGALSLVILVALIIGGNAFFSQRSLYRSIPARPPLLDWPLDFRTKIIEADGRAHSWTHSKEGLAELSQLYHANAFYNEAVQCYEGLRKVSPKNAHWPHLEASILSGFGRAGEAVPLYQKANALDPHYIPTLIKLGDILLKAGQSDPALAAYQQALNIETHNPYALLGIARISIAQGNWNKAREALEQALKYHPDFSRGIELLVTVEEHFGNPAAANAWRAKISPREFSDIPDPWLDALIDECYDPYRISVAADVAKAENDTTNAIRLLDRAIDLAPAAGSYHRERGLILLDLKDFRGARAEALQATTLSPNDPYAWTFLIKVLNQMEATDEAVHAISEGLAHCPMSPDLHILHARAFQDGGLLEEAAAEYKEAHRLWPSEASPLLGLANADFALNKTKEGIEALLEANKRQPNNPTVLLSLTMCEISLGDQKAADSFWGQLNDRSKTPPQAIAAVQAAYAKHFGQTLP